MSRDKDGGRFLEEERHPRTELLERARRRTSREMDKRGASARPPVGSKEAALVALVIAALLPVADASELLGKLVHVVAERDIDMLAFQSRGGYR